MGSKSTLLPLIADCERGVGRPERAIELARGPEAEALTGDDADELRIVVAGARADLGQLEQALAVLSSPPLEPGRTGQTAARLYYAYAETLLALGRDAEALDWFLKAAGADIDGVTDAEERIGELATWRPSSRNSIVCCSISMARCSRGHEPTEGAVDALAGDRARNLFVTNNASRAVPPTSPPTCATSASRRTRRRRHQRPERGAAARPADPGRSAGPRGRYRRVGRRDRRGRIASGADDSTTARWP